MILVLGVAERRMVFKRLERKKERGCCGGQPLLGVICVHCKIVYNLCDLVYLDFFVRKSYILAAVLNYL